MDIDAIRNKLITYKNYENLDRELVKEIQSTLLTKTKLADFEALLKKVEESILYNRKNPTTTLLKN